MRLGCRERAFWGLVVLACALGACSADCSNFVSVDEVPDDHKVTTGNEQGLPSVFNTYNHPPYHTAHTLFSLSPREQR